MKKILIIATLLLASFNVWSSTPENLVHTMKELDKGAETVQEMIPVWDKWENIPSTITEQEAEELVHTSINQCKKLSNNVARISDSYNKLTDSQGELLFATSYKDKSDTILLVMKACVELMTTLGNEMDAINSGEGV